MESYLVVGFGSTSAVCMYVWVCVCVFVRMYCLNRAISNRDSPELLDICE